ncbi:MAG: terminase, partial [Erysipelotrichia bacterium]|nr:terminase [Erysipelotrichia bacterium]
MASAITVKAKKIGLKPNAFSVYKDRKRFRVLASGRRFGKSWLSAAELLKFASAKAGAVCWYVAPSYRMAERIMWPILKENIPAAWILKKNETKLIITLINGSTISLCGAENYDSLRGSGIDFVVLDEFAFMSRVAWDTVIRPALATGEGHALFISSPDGLNHFYDFYKRGVVNFEGEWKSWRFTTIQGGWVTAKEIQSAQRELDSRTFEQEYLGEFKSFSGRVAYNFSDKNYEHELFHNIHKPLLIGFDFNNAPGVAAIAQEQLMPGQFEEKTIGNE